jgi:hypothetical protein
MKKIQLVHLLGVHIASCAFDSGGDIGNTLVHIHFRESEIGNLSNHFG